MLIIEDSDNRPIVYKIDYTYDSSLATLTRIVLLEPPRHKYRTLIKNEIEFKQEETESQNRKGIKVDWFNNLVTMIKRKFK